MILEPKEKYIKDTFCITRKLKYAKVETNNNQFTVIEKEIDRDLSNYSDINYKDVEIKLYPHGYFQFYGTLIVPEYPKDYMTNPKNAPYLTEKDPGFKIFIDTHIVPDYHITYIRENIFGPKFKAIYAQALRYHRKKYKKDFFTSNMNIYIKELVSEE